MIVAATESGAPSPAGDETAAAATVNVVEFPAVLQGVGGAASIHEAVGRGYTIDSHRFLRLLTKVGMSLNARSRSRSQVAEEQLFAIVAWMESLRRAAGLDLWVERAVCALVVIFHRRGSLDSAFRAYDIMTSSGWGVPICTLGLLIELCLKEGDLDRAVALLAEADRGAHDVLSGRAASYLRNNGAIVDIDGLPSWVSAKDGHLLVLLAAHFTFLGGAGVRAHSVDPKSGEILRADEDALALPALPEAMQRGILELAPAKLREAVEVIREARRVQAAGPPAGMRRRLAVIRRLLLRPIQHLVAAFAGEPGSAALRDVLVESVKEFDEMDGSTEAEEDVEVSGGVDRVIAACPPTPTDLAVGARAVLKHLRGVRCHRRVAREDFDDMFRSFARRKNSRSGVIIGALRAVVTLAECGSAPLESCVRGFTDDVSDSGEEDEVGGAGHEPRSDRRSRRRRGRGGETGEVGEAYAGEADADEEEEPTAGWARGWSGDSAEPERDEPHESDERDERGDVGDDGREGPAPAAGRVSVGPPRPAGVVQRAPLEPLGEPPNLHLSPDCDMLAAAIEALFPLQDGGAERAEAVYALCKAELVPNPAIFSAVIFGRIAAGDGNGAAAAIFEMEETGFVPHHRYLHRFLRAMGPYHRKGIEVIRRFRGPSDVQLRLFHTLIEACMEGSDPSARAVEVHEALVDSGLQPNSDTQFALIKAIAGIPEAEPAQKERERLQADGLLPLHPAVEALLCECHMLMQRQKRAWIFMETRRWWVHSIFEAVSAEDLRRLNATYEGLAKRAAGAMECSCRASPCECPAPPRCIGLLPAYLSELPIISAGLHASQFFAWRYLMVRSAEEKSELQRELDDVFGGFKPASPPNDGTTLSGFDHYAFVIHTIANFSRLELSDSIQLRIVRMLFLAAEHTGARWDTYHAELLEEQSRRIWPDVLTEVIHCCPQRAGAVPFAGERGRELLRSLVINRYLSRSSGEPIKFTTALRFVRDHGLVCGMPDEIIFRPVISAFADGFMQHAYTLCENDAAIQARLVAYAMARGERRIAGRLAERFRVDDNRPPPAGWDSAAAFQRACAECIREAEDAEERDLREANAKRIAADDDSGCLALPPEVVDSVFLVENEAQLETVSERFATLLDALRKGAADSADDAALLRRGACIGLDVEWRPGLEKRSGMQKHRRSAQGQRQEPCSTLQVAADDFAAVFDLLRLAPEGAPGSQALSALVTAVFEEPRLLKLGYGLQNDLQRLASSYPHMACFRQVTTVLDVQEASLRHSGSKCPAGLSALCAQQFGKPLSKRLQTSDWGARPLTSEQVSYAALDAFCLIGLARGFGEVAVQELHTLRAQTSNTGQVIVRAFSSTECPRTDIEELERVDQAIASKGSEIRALKAGGQPKSVWQAEVARLMQLKARFRELSGADWVPNAAVAVAAAA